MTSPTERILDALERAGFAPKKRHDGSHRSRCPVCDGENPTKFSLCEGDDGAPLGYCFDCAATAEEAAKSVGLSWPEVMNGHESGRSPAKRARAAAPKVTRYEGRDARTGEVVGVKIREDPPGGGKKKVRWDRKGVDVDTLALHGAERLDEIDHPDRGLVFICEGEKAADAWRARGQLAFGSMGGASKTPSMDALKVVAGLNVVLHPDNDQPGVDHMTEIGRRVAPIAKSLYVIKYRPGDEAKCDAADLPFAMPDDQVLEYLLDRVQVFRPYDGLCTVIPSGELSRYSDGEPEWIVGGFLARGHAVVLHGPAKVGKSELMKAMTGAVARGDAEFLGKPMPGKPMHVVLVTEEPKDRLTTAEKEYGWPPGMVHVVPRWAHPNAALRVPGDVSRIIEAARSVALHHGACMVVIDTLPGWSGAEGDDENSSGVMTNTVQPFRALAIDDDLGVLLLAHSTKTKSKDPIATLRGSGAIAAEVDAVLKMMVVPRSTDSDARLITGGGRGKAYNEERFVRRDSGSLPFTFHSASAHKRGLTDEHREVLERALRAMLASGDTKITQRRLKCEVDAVKKGAVPRDLMRDLLKPMTRARVLTFDAASREYRVEDPARMSEVEP